MHKKILLAVIVLFAFSGVSFAQTNTMNTTQVASPGAMKERFQNLKDQKQKTRELIQQQKNNFREKMAAIKDTRKKALVEKISSNIAVQNTRFTTKLTNALTRMSDALTSMKNKSAALKISGKNTTSLDTAIAAAEAVIANAKTQVAAQAEKAYTAEIADDATLKNVIGQMFQQFRKDIQATHQLVISAKNAVIAAAKELSKIDGENTATGSANVD